MVRIWVRRGGVAIAAAVLLACAGTPQQPTSDDSGLSALPADVSDALLPGFQLPAASAPVSTATAAVPSRYFDVDVQNLDARVFFRSLVDGTDRSVVIAPDVKGRITLKLSGVSIEDVLETVRDVYGYQISAQDRRIIVRPASLQTRTFQVNYLNLRRTGQSSTRVTSGQIAGTVGSGDDDGGNIGADGGSSGGGGSDRDARASIGSSIETASESDFWRELAASLNLIVQGKDGHRMALNPESGLVVVRATPDVLREVAEYLAALHANMHRQVILETKILEVTLSDEFRAGVNWAVVAQTANDTLTAGIIGGSNVFDQGLSAIADTPLTITPGNPVTGFQSSAIGGAFIAAVDLPDFSAVIELLEQQGDVQVLSSPRISTVNNQKAIIKVGTDEFFVTEVTQNQVVAAGATAAQAGPSVELTPFFSGIALDVTPRIYEPQDVILHVHPTVSEVTQQTKNLIIGGEQQSLPLAVSNLRETDSIVRARSGQVVVIGGLMQTSTRDEQVGLPGLSRIPLIGALFRQTRRSTLKSELVILMRPLVVDADGRAWTEDLERTQRRVEQLGSKVLINEGWSDF